MQPQRMRTKSSTSLSQIIDAGGHLVLVRRGAKNPVWSKWQKRESPRERDAEALVILRLADWEAWHGPGKERPALTRTGSGRQRGRNTSEDGPT